MCLLTGNIQKSVCNSVNVEYSKDYNLKDDNDDDDFHLKTGEGGDSNSLVGPDDRDYIYAIIRNHIIYVIMRDHA